MIIKQTKKIISIIGLLCAHTCAISDSFTSVLYEYHQQDAISWSIDKMINSLPLRTHSLVKKQGQKEWTVLIYIAAANNLARFSQFNLEQMYRVGSQKRFNIVVHLDVKDQQGKKHTWRLYVKKGELVAIDGTNNSSATMDSGDPQTLISFCKMGISQFPAKKYALILWDHGTGYLDPLPGTIARMNHRFTLNEKTNMFDLCRPYLSEILRGICWDETTGNYLSNQKLQYALRTICNESLNGKKFDIIGFDACLMSMLETHDLIAPFAHYAVGSQEVELGTGWNYERLFSYLKKRNVSARDFASQMVKEYYQTYCNVTRDFTMSAVDLSCVSKLVKNLDLVSNLLSLCIKYQKEESVKKVVMASRRVCTRFNQPSFVDFGHLYDNLQKGLSYIKLRKNTVTKKAISALRAAIKQGKTLLGQAVFANMTGTNLGNAQGVSIYFPVTRIHPSYARSDFAKDNSWYKFLLACRE